MSPARRSGRGVLTGLVLASLTLVALDARPVPDSPVARLHALGQAVLGPVQVAAADAAGRGSPRADAELRRLRAENARLRRELRTGDLARSRAADLDRLLRLTATADLTVVPARVVAAGAPQAVDRTVTIDAGRRDGITASSTVVNGDGLVGRVVDVGPATATVRLVTDPSSTVGVRLARTLTLGMVTGGGEPLHLDVLDGRASLARGDVVVTAGSPGGRPYVPGVPVGVVAAVAATSGAATRTASVRPYLRAAGLDLVGVVVVPPRTAARPALPPGGAGSGTGAPSAAREVGR